MTTNGTNPSEDTEMGECDGDKVVTMLDVLQEEQDFEEDANAVLGASDDKNCSYDKGYIKRQAIYACMTCCYDAKIDPLKRAGVCLGCSLTCHENHELIELYTKRNFRCDCGNAKFNSHPCQFNPNKTDPNEDNKYNQNYSGLYCTCHRPYPDPEATIEDEMIQCIICEDWLHASHLDAVVPDEPYSEMICKDCMEKNKFLQDYSSFAITTENVDVDIVSTSDTITSSNSATESVETLEKIKESDVEMKNEAEISLSDQTTTEVVPQIEKSVETLEITKEPDVEMKNKAEINLSDQISTIVAPNSGNATIATNELEKEKNEEVSNNTNINSMPEILSDKTILEKELSGKEMLEDKTVEEQSIEVETPNIVSENTTLIVDKDKIDCKINLPNTELSINEETIEDGAKNVNKKSEEDIKQDTNAATTDKPNSKGDIPTDINESKNITDIDQKISKIEEDLVNKPTNTETDIDQQQEEISSEITKSNIVSDNIPVTDNTENITALEHLMDAKEETVKNVVEKSDLTKTESEIIGPDNPATISDPNKDELQKTQETTKEDEETNHIATDHSNKENNIENSNETATNSINENKRKLSTEEDKDDGAKRVKPNEMKCIRPKGIKKHLKGATFWPSNFRQKLCTCNECLSMYKDLAVLFLIDCEDTVAAYETLGKERSNGNSQYEKGLQALSSLDRIQQINAVTEYNKLREKLSEFLQSFMLKKEIVKEEDIKAFFAGMKPKREPDGVYFCR